MKRMIFVIIALIYINAQGQNQLNVKKVQTKDLINSETATLAGDSLYLSPLPDEATKVGRALHVRSDGGVEWISPANFYKQILDTVANENTAIPYNFIRVYSVDTVRVYDDFSDAVDGAKDYDIIEVNASTYTETGTVTMPTGCVLKIARGGVISGSFTLALDSTYIVAGAWRIFGNSVTITGTALYDVARPEWFGADMTGTLPADDAFTDLEQIMHAGSTILGYPGATYFLEGSVNWKLYDDLTVDLQGATLYSDDGLGEWNLGYITELDDDFLPYYLMQEDSSLFIEDASDYEFKKGYQYVLIADSMDFKNNDNYRTFFKLNIATTATSAKDPRYHRSLSMTFDKFGTVGANQAMYAKLPFPLGLEVYDTPLYDTTGGHYIQMVPLYENIALKNINLLNSNIWLANFYNARVENIRAVAELQPAKVVDQALKFNNGDGLVITNCQMHNYDKSGMGYGLNIYQVDNVIIDNCIFGEHQHGATFSTDYFSTAQNVTFNNITIQDCDLDCHGNTFNVTVTNVNSYGGKYALNIRSNGLVADGIRAFAPTTPLFFLKDQDGIQDDYYIIKNVEIHNSTEGVVKASGINTDLLEISNVNYYNPDSSSSNKYVLKADSCVIDNLKLTNVNYINQNSIGALTYYIYLNYVTAKDVTVQNSDIYGTEQTFYLNNNFIDNFTLRQNNIELFDVMLYLPDTPADSMRVFFSENRITNGQYLTSFANTSKWIRFYLNNNYMNVLSGIAGGSPDNFTMRWDGNLIRNFVSAGKLIPANTDSVWFFRNTIQDNNLVEFNQFNNLRTGTYTALTWADSVLFTGTFTGAYFNFQYNNIYCEPANGLSDFYFNNGQVIINNNDFRLPRMGAYMFRLDNLTNFEFCNNSVVVNNSSLSRWLYAYTDATTQGKYLLTGNYINNRAGTYGQFWDERDATGTTGFENGSTVYVGDNYYIGVNPDDHLTTTATTGITYFLFLKPMADPPTDASEGMMYMDTDHHLYIYNGSTWVQCDN